jgi:hypothetical protein
MLIRGWAWYGGLLLTYVVYTLLVVRSVNGR